MAQRSIFEIIAEEQEREERPAPAPEREQPRPGVSIFETIAPPEERPTVPRRPDFETFPFEPEAFGAPTELAEPRVRRPPTPRAPAGRVYTRLPFAGAVGYEPMTQEELAAAGWKGPEPPGAARFREFMTTSLFVPPETQERMQEYWKGIEEGTIDPRGLPVGTPVSRLPMAGNILFPREIATEAPGPISRGLQLGVVDLVQEFTSPTALALIAVIPPVFRIPALKVFGELGIGAMALQHLMETTPEFVERWKEGDIEGASRVGVSVLGSAGIGTMAVRGAARTLTGRLVEPMLTVRQQRAAEARQRRMPARREPPIEVDVRARPRPEERITPEEAIDVPAREVRPTARPTEPPGPGAQIEPQVVRETRLPEAVRRPPGEVVPEDYIRGLTAERMPRVGRPPSPRERAAEPPVAPEAPPPAEPRPGEDLFTVEQIPEADPITGQWGVFRQRGGEGPRELERQFRTEAPAQDFAEQQRRGIMAVPGQAGKGVTEELPARLEDRLTGDPAQDQGIVTEFFREQQEAITRLWEDGQISEPQLKELMDVNEKAWQRESARVEAVEPTPPRERPMVEVEEPPAAEPIVGPEFEPGVVVRQERQPFQSGRVMSTVTVREPLREGEPPVAQRMVNVQWADLTTSQVPAAELKQIAGKGEDIPVERDRIRERGRGAIPPEAAPPAPPKPLEWRVEKLADRKWAVYRGDKKIAQYTTRREAISHRERGRAAEPPGRPEKRATLRPGQKQRIDIGFGAENVGRSIEFERDTEGNMIARILDNALPTGQGSRWTKIPGKKVAETRKKVFDEVKEIFIRDAWTTSGLEVKKASEHQRKFAEWLEEEVDLVLKFDPDQPTRPALIATETREGKVTEWAVRPSVVQEKLGWQAVVRDQGGPFESAMIQRTPNFTEEGYNEIVTKMQETLEDDVTYVDPFARNLEEARVREVEEARTAAEREKAILAEEARVRREKAEARTEVARTAFKEITPKAKPTFIAAVQHRKVLKELHKDQFTVVKDGIATSSNGKITVMTRTDLADGVYSPYVKGDSKAFRKLQVAPGVVAQAPDPVAAEGKQGRITIEAKSSDLQRAQRILKTVGETRYALSAVQLTTIGKNKARLVTTDGHRLIVNEIPFEGRAEKGKSWLIDSRALDVLLKEKKGEKIELLLDADVVTAMGPNIAVSNKISGQFPNWEMVLPKQLRHELVISKSDLDEILKKAKLEQLDEEPWEIYFQRTPEGLNVMVKYDTLSKLEEVAVTYQPGVKVPEPDPKKGELVPQFGSIGVIPVTQRKPTTTKNKTEITIQMPVQAKEIETAEFALNRKYIEDIVKGIKGPTVLIGQERDLGERQSVFTGSQEAPPAKTEIPEADLAPDAMALPKKYTDFIEKRRKSDMAKFGKISDRTRYYIDLGHWLDGKLQKAPTMPPALLEDQTAFKVEAQIKKWFADRNLDARGAEGALAGRVPAVDEAAFMRVWNKVEARVREGKAQIVDSPDLVDEAAQDLLASAWERRQQFLDEKHLEDWFLAQAQPGAQMKATKAAREAAKKRQAAAAEPTVKPEKARQMTLEEIRDESLTLHAATMKRLGEGAMAGRMDRPGPPGRKPPPPPPPKPPATPPPPGEPPPEGPGEALAEARRMAAGAEPRPKSIFEWVRTAPYNIQKLFTSEFQPLKHAEDIVYKEHSRELPVTNMARRFELQAGAHGKARADVYEFDQNVVELLPRRSQLDFDTYVVLERIRDRLADNPQVKRVGEWTLEKADRAIRELEGDIGSRRFQIIKAVAHNEYQEAMDRSLRLQVTSGRLSREVYDQIKEHNPFYGPFKILQTIEEIESLPGTGRNIATTQAYTRAIRGIDDDAVVFESIIKRSREMIYQSRILAEKNRKMLELDKLMEMGGESNPFKKADPDRYYQIHYKPAEDILHQLAMQETNRTGRQTLEHSLMKVGRAIELADSVGLTLKKRNLRASLGRATIGGVDTRGKVNLMAFTSDVIAHELGHAFDVPLRDPKTGKIITKEKKVFGVERDIVQRLSTIINIRKGVPFGKRGKFQQELAELVKYTKLAGTPAYRAKATERFAEFVNLYIHDPKMARKLAPQWTDYFEKEILPQQKIKHLVERLGAFFQKADKLPNIMDDIKDMGGLKYIELAIRRAFPERKPQLGVRFGSRPKPGQEILFYFKDGKRQAMMMPTEHAQAVRGLHREEASLTGKWMRFFSQPLRLGATAYNVRFQLRNLLAADLPRATLMSRYGLRMRADETHRALTDWVYALYSAFKLNLFTPNQLGMDFLKSGAANSGIQSAISPKTFDPTVERNWAMKVLDTPGRISQAIEETSKLFGLRRAMRHEGLREIPDLSKIDDMPPEEALELIDYIAVEIRNYSGSPDFLRGGQLVTGPHADNLNFLFMFLRARIQGQASDITRLGGRTGKKEGRTAWIRISSIFAAATALALYNRLDGNREDYDKRAPWETDNYFLIPRYNEDGTPKMIRNENGELIRDYYRWPKREITMLVGNFVEAAVNFAYERDPEAVKDFGVSFLENVSPVSVSGKDMQERVESIVSGLNPLFKVPIEYGLGRDTFRHRDVVPQYIEGVPSRFLSPSEQYTSTTPDIFVKLGQASGISPLIIEQLVRGATAGLVTQFTPRKRPGRPKVLELPLIGPTLESFVGSEYLATVPDDELEEALRGQGDAQVNINRKSEQIHQAWLEEDPKPYSLREFVRLQGGTQEHLTKVRDIMQDTRLGLTYTDRLIKQLQIGNGERANYIAKKAVALEGEERSTYLQDLRRKRILTPEVTRQVNAEIRRLEEPAVVPEP